MTYPAERKAAVIAKMLAPHKTPLRQLSQEEGISEGTATRAGVQRHAAKANYYLTHMRVLMAGRRVTSLRRCLRRPQ
jgi:hypothetical protein